MVCVCVCVCVRDRKESSIFLFVCLYEMMSCDLMSQLSDPLTVLFVQKTQILCPDLDSSNGDQLLIFTLCTHQLTPPVTEQEAGPYLNQRRFFIFIQF